MKKFLLFFLSLLAIGTAQAAPNFKANTKYRISCKKFNSSNSYGSVVIGSNHSKLVELYYDSGNSYSDDSWWYINKSGNGYVIVNAKSGQYLTFTTTKNYRTKYVTLTNAASGNESQWIFDINEDGYAGIASASEGNGSGYHFNVRIDGTNLFGAYRANYYDENELFKIYDEQGNNVLLDNSGSGGETGGGSGGETGGEGTDDFNATTHGKTSYGEYWERTQLKQPIVYTTSVADPVLYSIANLRTGRYVGVGTSKNTNTTCLTEVYSASDRTQFYFVQSGTGVQIFTKDGQYVSTNYPTPDNSVSDKRAGLSVVNGTPNGNLWGFGWTTNTYLGYTITKLDNLSATDATQYKYNSWNDYSLDNNTGSSNVHEVGLYEGDDAGSSFVFTSADLRHAKYLQNKGIDFGLDVTPKAFAEAFDSLRINDKQLVYDSKGNAYFATLPEGMRNGGDYTAKVTYKLKATNAEGETEEFVVSPGGVPAAFVWKTVSDQYGKFSMIKVIRGKVTSDMSLYNMTTGNTEKLGRLYTMKGKKAEETKEICCGDIGAIGKMDKVKTGDTLCEPKTYVKFAPLAFAPACYERAISPKTKQEIEKLGTGLNKLNEEDPTFSVTNNAETHQTVISGAGDIQIDVLCSKLKSRFGVDAELDTPRVAYREKIRSTVRKQGRYKKQTGGSGQFGDVHIIFEPQTEQEDMIFEENVFGGSVPKNYFPAVEKGLRESCLHGVLAGYPVVFLKATLVDGSYHPVDSSEIAFKLAANLAFKAALPEAKPVLMEPIGELKVTVPDNYVGDVMGDLNKRRGRVMGMNPTGDGEQVLEAEVPMAEMMSYAIDLRSMTQSRGTFTFNFVRYEDCPAAAQEKAIAAAKALAEAE